VSITGPDATKGNHCKHIVRAFHVCLTPLPYFFDVQLFIFLKGLSSLVSFTSVLIQPYSVLQVTRVSGYWYQKFVANLSTPYMLTFISRALLTSELEQIFAEAPLAPNSFAHPRIREAHARAIGKTIDAAPSTSGKNKRMPGEDDDCPICYESMHGVNEKSLVFCEDCGNALHKECFQQCTSLCPLTSSEPLTLSDYLCSGQASSSRDGKPLTCVWCRARWIIPASTSAGTSGDSLRRSDGYINLADVSGASPIRDTNTCTFGFFTVHIRSDTLSSSVDYHGPRRGQRYYGYQDYD
jgi:hypothetical protein